MIDRNAIKASAEAAVQEQKDWVAAGSKWPQATLKLWVFRAHMNPEAALELIRLLEQREDGPLCWTCGDMGDVHRADGEWLGTCDQCNVYELKCVKHELAQAQQVIAEHVEPVSVNTMERREKWLQNIADAIKFGLPNYLRERLQNTEKQIRGSMRYGGTKRLRDEIERLTADAKFKDKCWSEERVALIDKLQASRAEVERKDEEYDKAWRHDLNDKNNVQVLTAEVVRLTAEVELLTAERDARVRQVRNALNDAEELRQDADRHRYWRMHTQSFHLTAPVTNEVAERHDAFIDEAMRKELQP